MGVISNIIDDIAGEERHYDRGLFVMEANADYFVFLVYENFDHSWQPYLDKRTTKNDSIFNYFTFFEKLC